MSERLKPCPLCGRKVYFKSQAVGGTGSSGMEPPDLIVGCEECGLFLKKESGHNWTPKKGVYSTMKETQQKLADKWNRRIQ